MKTDIFKGKKILIGVTGGIAIYKVLDLISRLRKLGAEVQVIMTEAATEFINPITFETMSDNTVYTDMWIHPGNVLHIDISKNIDLFLIAPASANTIAKVNSGIADNLLTSTILASQAPISFALAMNSNMLNNPITQRNINDLKNLGYDFIDSNSGQLACNTVGDGRMAEPVEIIDHLEMYFTRKDLLGKKIIVTAGATESRIDPVRFISNDSSGKMGYELARAARNRGAEVIYIKGRVRTPKLKDVIEIDIDNNNELEFYIKKYIVESDSLIMAAAPVDYKIEKESKEKIKKSLTKKLSLNLVENKDILKETSKITDGQILIGFAAETNDIEKNALGKLKNKGLDYIVANDVSKEGAGFNVDTNIISIYGKNNYKKHYPILSKTKVANKILDLLV